MKKLLTLLITLSVLLLNADPLNIPLTSEIFNMSTPLKEGQIAYIPNPDGNSAQLYIGNGTIEPYPVLDPAVLRGRTLRIINESEVLIEIDSNIHYEDGYYYIENLNPIDPQNPSANSKIVGKMTISVDGKKISKVSYNSNYTDYIGRFGTAGNPNIKISYEDGKCILTWTQDEMSKGRVFGFKVYYSPLYMNYMNDLTDIDYYCRDTLGSSYLSTWRQFCIEYWQRANQLGKDWYRYPAFSNIRLNSKSIIYDGTNSVPVFNTKYDEATSNLVTYGKYYPLMTMVARGGETTASGSLRISAINVDTPSTGLCTIEFEQSITGFNIDNLQVVTTDSLDQNGSTWMVLTPISKSSSGTTGSFVVSMKSTENHKFWKLVYDSIQSGVYQVIFRGQVIIYDGLILRSESGNTFWKIKVNDSGTISTQQVTDNMPSM